MMRFGKTLTAAFGILLLLLFIGAGLAVTLSCRSLYTSGIDEWRLTDISGLDRDTIIRNYDMMMDWTSPFHREALVLQDYTLSPSAARHFAECKVLFDFFLIAGAAALPLCVLLTVRFAVAKRYGSIMAAGLISLVIPVVFVLFALIDFDTLFVIFHKAFFNNDMWIFDRATDPVIDILPEAYFMRCAFLLGGIVIGGGVLVSVLGAACQISRRAHCRLRSDSCRRRGSDG